jgi:hypothetical protein
MLKVKPYSIAWSSVWPDTSFAPRQARRPALASPLQRLFTLALLVLTLLPLVALESPVPAHDYPGWGTFDTSSVAVNTMLRHYG